MTGPNERDEIAWMVHRSCGCGPTVGFDGKPGPICEPDREDWAAADAILGWLAERDRRTAATAVRAMGAKFRIEARETWGGDVGWTTTGSKVAVLAASWCDQEAERIERGE